MKFSRVGQSIEPMRPLAELGVRGRMMTKQGNEIW
jgi:hypothetical protein